MTITGDARRCERCGGTALWVECDACDDGYTEPGELYNEDPLWYTEDDVEPCHVCMGMGGWWWCDCEVGA